MKANSHTFRVIIEPDGKHFHAYVPALSGCHTFGKTITEAKKNVREAISVHIEGLVKLGEEIPTDNSFELFETVALGKHEVYV
jgi:predicted RNase H-like HicB family nuclease